MTSGQPYAASNNKTDYFVIVADVTYQYAPSFGFQAYQWGQPANGGSGYTITQTTYMNSRFKDFQKSHPDFDSSAFKSDRRVFPATISSSIGNPAARSPTTTPASGKWRATI